MQSRTSGFKCFARLAVAWLVAAACASASAAAPAWKPEKAIELIAPSAPGGGTDKTARLIQKIWQDRRVMEGAVTVGHKSGGQGQVAVAYLKGHARDAHFLQILSAGVVDQLRHT